MIYNYHTASEQKLVRFAQKMVSTPSLTGEEAAVAELLAAELKDIGYRDVNIDEYGNVTGIFGDGDPKLMFNGHIDHVPPGEMEDPYGASIVSGASWGEQGDAIRGRGSCDMKANVAAGAYAPLFLREILDAPLAGAYLFAADVQEEIDSPKGVPYLLSKGVRADYGISGESTSLKVSLGHRGKVQFDIKVQGQSSHASNPDNGVNAVYNAIPLIKALQAYHARLPSNSVYGSATNAITRISSEPNGDVAVVPPVCTIRIDRRYIPGETPETVQNELENLVSEIADKEQITANLELVNIYPLMSIDNEHSLVYEGLKAIDNVIGNSSAPVTWKFGVNATFMSEVGIPCIGIGPGDEQYAHTPEEHAPVREVIDSSRIYAALIKQICS